MVEQEHARILLIDDEASIRVTLAALLTRRGYQVSTAGSAEEARDVVMRASFDLLLVDLKLPGIDGLAFALFARHHQSSAAILFITGSSDFVGATVEEQVGHFDYILKTASPQEVLARVAAIVG